MHSGNRKILEDSKCTLQNTAEFRLLHNKKYQEQFLNGIIAGINNYVAGVSMTADNLPE
jgi:hypothetical protein